jgi:Lrp/AsnC family transcriptional regulator, cysteine-sensing transcriptional activator
MPAELDPVDRTILMSLQGDASLSTAEIALKAGASQSSVWRRIEKMERSGIIKKRVALLDRKKLGLDMMVFAHVKLQAHGQRTLPQFEEAIRRFPEVVDCYTLLGETDYLLRVVTRDTASYEAFFRKHLSQVASVQFTNSSMTLSEVKTTTELPLSLLW